MVFLELPHTVSSQRSGFQEYALFTGITVDIVAAHSMQWAECGRPGFDPRFGKVPWRRERLPTPVFWPGEFRGLDSPWGQKESDTTE